MLARETRAAALRAAAGPGHRTQTLAGARSTQRAPSVSSGAVYGSLNEGRSVETFRAAAHLVFRGAFQSGSAFLEDDGDRSRGRARGVYDKEDGSLGGLRISFFRSCFQRSMNCLPTHLLFASPDMSRWTGEGSFEWIDRSVCAVV